MRVCDCLRVSAKSPHAYDCPAISPLERRRLELNAAKPDLITDGGEVWFSGPTREKLAEVYEQLRKDESEGTE